MLTIHNIIAPMNILQKEMEIAGTLSNILATIGDVLTANNAVINNIVILKFIT